MGNPEPRDKSFARLDPRIRKWVYKSGWTELRDIQIEAIDPIMDANTDIVISASTASGKTEAVFLPLCSVIADQEKGFGAMYISPLKALINDQKRRLESLCEPLSLPTTSWHGDSSVSEKKRIEKHPRGIILITPESLESLLLRKSDWLIDAFSHLKYIVIDEYHSFLNSVRGFQLHALLHRLEVLLQLESPIPRLALSATLGDMDSVITHLRPNEVFPCTLIEGETSGFQPDISINAYQRVLPEGDVPGRQPEVEISKELYNTLRGNSHLVFANSRKVIEEYSVRLSDKCEADGVPNEFFPHHGSLSKSIRDTLEKRLQKENLPTTALCTMTLELGIDVGKVSSVCQLNAPHSVASLRQRVGRSGRRGSAPVLKMYICEREQKLNAGLGDALHLELLQSIAMVKLLCVDKWYEPADRNCFHFSTLLHQILAIIGQWGGVRADQLWRLLVESGSFPNVEVEHFKALLSAMGTRNLISQLSSDVLALAEEGERIVNHFTFYAVFKTPSALRLMNGNEFLGEISSANFIKKSKHLIFAGRRWEVLDFQKKKKTIYVAPAGAGKVPKFGGGPMRIHEKVRREMFAILSGKRVVPGLEKILDAKARDLFEDAKASFKGGGLENQRIVRRGEKKTAILTWSGDKIARTLLYLLLNQELKATLSSGIIYVNSPLEDVVKALKAIAGPRRTSALQLASLECRAVKEEQKYDMFLPDRLLDLGFAARSFDVPGVQDWIKKYI